MPNLAAALTPHYPDEMARWVGHFCRRPGDPNHDAARSITRGIKDEFVYTRRNEKGIQSPNETLQSRRGSCRDFAVLMMEATGAWSGGSFRQRLYLCAAFPASGRARRRCNACVDAGLPAGCRVGRFDPTNSLIGNRNLIRVAVAWDPAQRCRSGAPLSVRPLPFSAWT